MNLSRVEQIAKAVLYEGYMLYPYRPSSVKNRQRFNFGVLYPKTYSEEQGGADACSMRVECLARGRADTRFEGRLRFLQLTTSSSSSEAQGLKPPGWQDAVERDFVVPEYTLEQLSWGTLSHGFVFPAKTEVGPDQVARCHESIEGFVDLSARRVDRDLFKVSLFARNTSHLDSQAVGRDAALMRSLVSTHAILGVNGGEFVSLLEPPEGIHEAAASCENVGAWPVLVGDPGERDTMLASPIILYDYPQIAPESAGDLFDGTEIDEILSLRIMTLTNEEKREIRESDERARLILERTESMPEEQFMKLHGAVRGLRPLKEDAS